MRSTLTKKPKVDFRASGEDERYIAMLAAMLHKLELRALAELFLNADPERSNELSKELWQSTIPAHRQFVTDLWVAAREFCAPGKSDGDAIRGALVSMNSDVAWWIRAQLPGGVYRVSKREDMLRRHVRKIWKELTSQ